MFLFIQQIFVDFHCVSGIGDNSGKQDSTLVSERRWGCDDGKEWVLGLKKSIRENP